MAETGTAGRATTTHPLVKKVHASKPPIARLIGFDVEEIERCRAVAVLNAGPQHGFDANTGGVIHDR